MPNPHILNLRLVETKQRKKEEEKNIREGNHNRCPRECPTLSAGISSVCDSIQDGENRCSSSMHQRRRITSVFVTLENQLETLYKSLLVLQLIQECSWDRWFTAAAPTGPCSAHQMAVEDAKGHGSDRGWGDYWGMRHPNLRLQPWNPENNWHRGDCGLWRFVYLKQIGKVIKPNVWTIVTTCTMFDHRDICGQTFFKLTLTMTSSLTLHSIWTARSHEHLSCQASSNAFVPYSEI